MQQIDQQQQEQVQPQKASLCSILGNEGSLHGHFAPTNKEPPSIRSTHTTQSYSQGRCRIRRSRMLIGTFLGASLSAVVLLSHIDRLPGCSYGSAARHGQPSYWKYHDATTRLFNAFCQIPPTPTAILDYIDFFWISRHSSTTFNETSAFAKANNVSRRLTSSSSRKLLGGTETSASDYPQLVVAGKITVEDGPCNIAQYNLKTKEWSLNERIQLSLYNSYSGGEVYSLLANHTFLPPPDSESEDDDSLTRYGSLFCQ